MGEIMWNGGHMPLQISIRPGMLSDARHPRSVAGFLHPPVRWHLDPEFLRERGIEPDRTYMVGLEVNGSWSAARGSKSLPAQRQRSDFFGLMIPERDLAVGGDKKSITATVLSEYRPFGRHSRDAGSVKTSPTMPARFSCIERCD